MAGDFIDPTGATKPGQLTPDGEVKVANAAERDLAETNRLLRKLIAGLEMWIGNEFPEVEQ